MYHPILLKVNGLITPDRLSYIQEIVFLRSCEGKKYREIAIESGYDYDYVKEVGFQLWKTLSQVLSRKVSKKNVRLLLAELPDPVLIDIPAGASTRHPVTIEFPNGPLSIESSFYVQRSALELLAYREILKPGGLLRIKAPRQMGKTSLVLRIIAHAQSQGLFPVLLDLQSADRRVFENLNTFLRWLCIHVSRQVNLEPQLDEYWDEESGSKISCNLYFQMFLLEQVKKPIVLIFDEITPLFEYPELAKDVLPLFRIWHELAAHQTSWQNLRLIIVHNIEIYVPLKVNQSPFNVGVPIELDGLTLEQTTQLAQYYQLDSLSESELTQLNHLVGGSPYHLQLAFYWLRNDLPIEKLLTEAATESGIYRQDLHRHLDRLQKSPSLLYSLREVINNSDLTTLEIITAYRLESLGLIKRSGNQGEIFSPLYKTYFKTHLQ
jgi:hypothetical protein